MNAEDLLYLLYTSGTTAKPKGIKHTTAGYLVGVTATHKLVFDLKEETDVYWCAADIGWVTGHSYIVYGPLCNGATSVIYEGTPDFPDKDRLWEIVERYKGADFPDTILFETGYDPSGLPHIGTFGEVARTSMVRHAFRVLTQDKVATKLLCFSDDMDGMRKIPDSVPDRSALEPHLHKPLSSVPNPFGGDYASFADHNNAMLCRFLDTFGFDYEFASATQYYKSGRFDAMLLRAAERYDQIMAVMLPTLGFERQATSPLGGGEEETRSPSPDAARPHRGPPCRSHKRWTRGPSPPDGRRAPGRSRDIARPE